MITEAWAEDEDAHLTDDGLRQAKARMQTNPISSEELEDGELEEEAESAQAYLNGDSIERFQVKGQRQQSLSARLMCHQGPSAIDSKQKDRPANAGIAVDRQEKSGMPNAVTSGGEISESCFAISTWENLTDFYSVKDEALKNLMMSWYYAGYYTGLYEGQHQVQSTPSK